VPALPKMGVGQVQAEALTSAVGTIVGVAVAVVLAVRRKTVVVLVVAAVCA
jgi:hypothetical protein